MYIRKIWECGKVREIEKTHSHRFNTKNFTRDPKHEKTSLAVQKQNYNNSFKKLRRIINANFEPSDYLISLTYDDYHKTTDPKQAKKDIEKFLRKIRDIYKKRGVAAKYVSVTELGKTGRSYHHHLVIKSENVPIGIISEIWENGGINFRSLKKMEVSLGDYSKVASYILKETYENVHEQNGVFKKRWNSSRNLIIPEPKIEIVSADDWKKDPVVPKGFMLVPDSLIYGVSEVTGYPYQFYRLVQIPSFIKEKPKEKIRKGA